MDRARTMGVVVTGSLVLGCGGGGTDYLGEPPIEAAADLAARACDNIFECGALRLACDPPSGSYMPATDFFPTEAACLDDLGAFYGSLLAGCAALGLTDPQAEDLNECFNYSRGCLSEAELMELAVAACADQPSGSEACFRSEATVDACTACFEAPDDPMCDGV